MNDPFNFQPSIHRFAVMGNPIKHSKSPQIHKLFALQFGFEVEYTAIQVDFGGFNQAVANFAAQAGAGLNITVPFKQKAVAIADILSKRAKLAGAVNTLLFAEQCCGDNTDGVGLIRDLTDNHNFDLQQRQILIIGAGGAVRGVLGPLLAAKPSRLLIANRTRDKALALSHDFKHLGRISGCGLDQIPSTNWDLIINGTATSLDRCLPDIAASHFAPAKLAYDMMYADQPTIFVNWALANGADHAVDGFGMLIEQAAESFYIWHKKRPQTRAVIHALRKL